MAEKIMNSILFFALFIVCLISGSFIGAVLQGAVYVLYTAQKSANIPLAVVLIPCVIMGLITMRLKATKQDPGLLLRFLGSLSIAAGFFLGSYWIPDSMFPGINLPMSYYMPVYFLYGTGLYCVYELGSRLSLAGKEWVDMLKHL